MFHEIISLVVALLVTISVHEAAHAWVANYLGDPTARYAGRISLNPLRHLDPLGTLAIFIVHFGWGKPVPVNPYNLRNPRKDQAIISMAGPLSNFATAALLALMVQYVFIPMLGADRSLALQLGQNPVTFLEWLYEIVSYTIDLCLVLMVFNLIPIPPLDGSKVLFAFLPLQYEKYVPQFERVGPMVLFVLIIASNVMNINVFGWLLGPAVDVLRSLIFLST